MATYPTINGGVTTQRPFTRTRVHRTTVNTMSTGKRYTYGWRATGLTGLPTRPLFVWELNYPVITPAEVETLEDFFRARAGRLEAFDFTDPEDGTTYPNCRFGMDAMEIRYEGPNYCSTRVVIEEFHA